MTDSMEKNSIQVVKNSVKNKKYKYFPFYSIFDI